MSKRRKTQQTQAATPREEVQELLKGIAPAQPELGLEVDAEPEHESEDPSPAVSRKATAAPDKRRQPVRIPVGGEADPEPHPEPESAPAAAPAPALAPAAGTGSKLLLFTALAAAAACLASLWATRRDLRLLVNRIEKIEAAAKGAAVAGLTNGVPSPPPKAAPAPAPLPTSSEPSPAAAAAPTPAPAPEVAAMDEELREELRAALLLLKKQTRFRMLADKAILEGSRADFQELESEAFDPANDGVHYTALAELTRVKMYFASGISIPPGYEIPVEEVLPDSGAKSERELTPDQVKAILHQPDASWQARARAAFLLSIVPGVESAEELAKATHATDNLMVLTACDGFFSARTGYRGGDPFKTGELIKWWDAHKADYKDPDWLTKAQ